MNRNLIVVCAGLLIVLPALVCFRYSLAVDTFDEETVREHLNRIPLRFGGYDLRLMSIKKDTNAIPTEGKNLIVVADVEGVLHFRIFDQFRKTIVDEDETKFPTKAQEIAALKKQLMNLWPPAKLPEDETERVIIAATSIVGHTPFGDSEIWKANKPYEEDESAFKDETYPGFMRRYENRGRQVLLLISGGPSGPLVYLHKPEQCYTAIGFSMHDESTMMRKVAEDTFAAADFTRKLPLPEHLRIYWAWSANGKWDAPKEPRLQFKGNQLLYRMYVVERTKSSSDEHEGSACEEFLKVAIPGIYQALFVDK